MGRVVWVVTGLIIIFAIIAAYFSLRPDRVTTPTVPASQSGSGNASVGATGASTVVTYTEDGFSPATIIVTPGTTVTWQNTSSGKLWVVRTGEEDSVCPSTNTLNECGDVSTGGTFSYTFTNPGTFTYVNRNNKEDTATIVVSGSASAAGPIRPNVILE